MSNHAPVTDWVHDFDHTDPRWTESPYAIWDELRAASPVVHTERFLGCYMPTTFEAVKQIAYDTEHFSSRRVVVRDERPDTIPAPPSLTLTFGHFASSRISFRQPARISGRRPE